MLRVYDEMPSVIYPIGSILEDEKMIMKVLKFQKARTCHAYQVEILQWKVKPSDDILQHFTDPKTPWIMITPYSIEKIKVLS